MQPRSMTTSRTRSLSAVIFVVISILLISALWSFKEHVSSTCSAILSTTTTVLSTHDCERNNYLQFNHSHDPPNPTFYDDSELSYAVDGQSITNWDNKRKQWLKLHPSFAVNTEKRIFFLSGSQPAPCKNPIGDFLLMKAFKNKVDYCRIHGYEFFYNNAVLQSKMDFCWAKIPMVRALMLAHPESEWIWWIDSDAIFTDMDFKLPLEKYKDYNFVVQGSREKIYREKTWLAVNAGVFLIRNCQWSLDFLDVWANMGPISPDFEEWGKTLSKTLTERTYEISDDQSALVYLMLTQKEKWGDKIYVETNITMNSYWLFQIRRFENITRKYEEVEKMVSVLRRRHAEVVSERYGELWEPYLRNAETDISEDWLGWKRPFITHFAGCQPCSGDHNPKYKEDDCVGGMERALNFADNQVLRNFGFIHPDLDNTSYVTPLPFDFPFDSSDLEVLI